jgi:hypothetical protein
VNIFTKKTIFNLEDGDIQLCVGKGGWKSLAHCRGHFFLGAKKNDSKKGFYSINILCVGQRALQKISGAWCKEVVIPILKGLCQDPDRVFFGRVSI